MQKYLKQKIKLSYGYLFFVSPAVGLALMEILNLSTIESIDLDFLFVNYLLYTLIHVFFYMIFRRIKLTSFFSLMLIYYVAIANYFVISFRGIPIIFGDIYSVKTAFSVSGGYDFTLNSNFTTSVLIFSAAVFLLLASSEKNYNKNEKIEELIKSSIVFITLIVITLFVYNSGFYFKDTTHTHWEPSSKFKKYGYLSSFIYDFTKTVSVEIDDYSVGEVDKILSKYPKDENLSDANHKPNIIVVMNEAFSDFDFIGDFETNKDYLPFYRSLEDNTIKGILTTSPERGGGTGYTEFEFLTGNSMAFLKGTNPYVQFINSDMPSMVSTLKDQNYQVLAMHPYKKTGYNRVSVYSHFGFEDFITMDSFDNPETVRGNISDLENYKKLIELYENRNKDKSFFIFNITMQNHGGYFDTGYEFKNPIEVTSYDVREDVDIFLSLMKESDLAFEYLINYFKNIGEDTLILIFGDHQPMLDDNFTEALFDKPLEDLSLEEKVKLYQVPFLIWANYDIEDRDIEKISINYLSSLLLDTAGVKTTSYNNYLLNQYRKMPIITANFYYDNKGDVYSFQESTILSDVIHDYEMIQYNNIFDLKNRLNKYFYIKN
jgi:phosphoglycerol transferase MdoB-like AlkP superfamily enzyme